MNRQRPLWRVLALFFVLAIVAAACDGDDDEDVEAGGTTTSTEAGEPTGQVGASVNNVLEFGAVLPQTGDLAAFGPSMVAGVELAVDDINAAGGVLGQDVGLQTADSGTDPDTANTATERLINTEQVDAILGAAGSTVSLLGVIEPTIGAGRLQCSGSNTSPAFTTYQDNDLYFRTAPSDKFQSRLLADTIAADGFSRVAVMNRADDYGQAFSDITSDELERAGAEVVAEVNFDPKATNFDADVAQVAEEQPEAVVVIAFPEEGANVLTAMIEQGVGPQDVAHYYTDGLADDTFPEAVSPDNAALFDGVKGTRPGSEGENEEFINRLRQEKGVETTTFAAQFYDCAVLIALGAEAAGTDDPEQIADTLIDVSSGGTKCTSFEQCKQLLDGGDDIDFDGITGFDLDDTGEPSEGIYELWEFRAGELAVLESGVIIRSEE